MNKVLLGAFAGLVAGAAGTFVVVGNRSADSAAPPGEIERDLADIPKMTSEVAEQHRDGRYEKLRSIEQILALPTHFAQSEALYLLAGRSGSAPVQNLIFEANRIADRGDRETALNILFFRLAEIDPPSAIALSRTEFFAGEKNVERQVWRAWGKLDLDAALAGAKSQRTAAERKSAAQALYAAFGNMGNETTDRIEAELGIPPDRSTRSRFLYRMADRSPTDAIEYINAMQSVTEQQEFVSWLAYYLSQNDPSIAATYAGHIENIRYRKTYKNIVANHFAKENPILVLDRLLGSERSDARHSEIYSAIQTLAGSDFDAALSYFDRADSAGDREMLAGAIAAEYARRDAEKALEWARENDRGGNRMLEMHVIHHIAAIDPEKALHMAFSSEDQRQRQNIMYRVLSTLAQDDPQAATMYLDEIPSPQERQNAAQQIVSQWIRHDPDAAVDWVLAQDEQTSRELLQQSAARLVRHNLDAALRLLPKLEREQTGGWRYQIAQALALQRSPEEALSFVSQFEGQRGFDNLQSAIVAGVAQRDPVQAKLLADQLPDGLAKDSAYASVIGRRAQTRPLEAAAWLDSISDDLQKGAAAGMLATQWHSHDPGGANRWVASLPAGTIRDDAVMHLSSRWQDPTPAQQELIESIADSEKRGQAVASQIFSVMRRDPVRARQMLQDADIPDYLRQRIESALVRHSSRSW